jgi:hypothetical protein
MRQPGVREQFASGATAFSVVSRWGSERLPRAV